MSNKARIGIGFAIMMVFLLGFGLLGLGLCCALRSCFPPLPPLTDPAQVVYVQSGEVVEITTRWNTFGPQAIPADPSALIADYDSSLLEYMDTKVVTEPTMPVSGRSSSRFTLRFRALRPGVTMVAIEAVEFYAGPPEPRTLYFTVAIDQSLQATVTLLPTPTTAPTPTSTPTATDTQGPPAPEPLSPTDNATLTCREEAILSWNTVSDPSGVAGYHVIALAMPASRWETWGEIGGWDMVGKWGPLDGTQMAIPVTCGYYYQWSVQAEDTQGNRGRWSVWARFNVSTD